MRALMGRIGFVAMTALVLLSSTVGAQVRDTLQVGDRVRVRVAATRGTANLFVGNLSSLTPDTLVIDIPGGKGSIILPRAAVAEVALSQGNVSRWKRAVGILPFMAPAVTIATLNPPAGPHHNANRNRQIFMGVVMALPFVSVMSRQPTERWEPVYRWLEGMPSRR